MPTTSSPRPWGLVLLAASLVMPFALVSAPQAAAADRTSTREARRVDRVKTPRITWVVDSERGGYTGAVKLPLDYDNPTGTKVTIALFKVPAADPSARIGTLFLNPGGPGGSGVDMAADATGFLSQSVLDRFDIVGFDPRGTNASTEVTCFPSADAQASALSGLSESFPSASEQAGFVSSTAKLAKGCSTYGKTLASAMSTAQVARDMDVLRRAVGDKKLTYLGFSYGSYLGEVYANLFPDRFRAITIDGVLDPVAYAGTSLTASIPTNIRLRGAEASWAALTAGLKACADAGPGFCPLSEPQADFDEVAAHLKAQPLTIGEGSTATEYHYATFVNDVHNLLYYPEGMNYIGQLVLALKQTIDSGSGTSAAGEAGNRAAGLVLAWHRATAALSADYDNGLEAYSGVLCTDTYQPASASAWAPAAAKADARAPHFGLLMGWTDVQCATSVWKAKDEDAYHGSYSRNTAAPVLVVGNYYDPATNYTGAVAASTLMPNSVLLRSASWGHTAYGTSDCATDRVDEYLLTGKVPAGTAATVCVGDVQPFQVSLDGSVTRQVDAGTLQVPTRDGLPTVDLPLTRQG